jgi:hypothetical protein
MASEEGVVRMSKAVSRVVGTKAVSDSVLAGMWWDAPTKQLVIYVVDGPNSNALRTKIDKAVSAVQGDYSHRFVAVSRSDEELARLAKELMSDPKVWAGSFAGDIVTVGPDHTTNGIMLGVTGHIAELKDRAQRRLAGVPVEVRQQAPLSW